MEYVQMTLGDWMEIKQKLKLELQGVKQSFVRIGYMLRKIDDQKAYESDGYKSIAEFAKAEYGLEASTVSRFMSINREYSVDGYSEMLRPEFEDLGRSQLEEMLKLPDSDRQMIRPETSREDIRELKRFNKAEPESGAADDIRELVKQFFLDNKDCLRAVMEDPSDIKKLSETINPSGSRSYRKGVFFLMMYENQIKIKKFGSDPQEMTWEHFIGLAEEIFRAMPEETWKENKEDNKDCDQGKTTMPEPEDTPVTEPERELAEEKKEEEKNEDEEPETAGKEEPEKEIAPAQKPAETLEKEAPDKAENKKNTEPQRTMPEPEREAAADEETEETEETYPRSEESGAEIMNPPDIADEPFGTRKDYMDTLTAYGMAVYMSEEYVRHSLKVSSLAFPSELETWLLTEVDDQGREMPESI